MVPRSQVGQKIVARAEGASHTSVQAAPERHCRLEKSHRDVKLGLRFGLHPQTKQVHTHVLVLRLPPATARASRHRRGHF